MPVDRALWTKNWSKTHVPAGWHCPTCRSGYLRLVPDSLRSNEGAASRQQHNEDWFDPEDAELRFSAMLECTNDVCKETVAVAGLGGWFRAMNDDESNWDWAEWYAPLFFYPPVHFFKVADGCPQPVETQIVRSFSTLWASPGAAANHVRIAIENLLDNLRISRAKRIKGVRMQRLSLHQRIEQLKSRMPETAEALLAIKWVGNAGSHLSELTRDDVFDAYDIIEHVLEELYVKNREATRKLIREINSRRGPRAKRARSRRE